MVKTLKITIVDDNGKSQMGMVNNGMSGPEIVGYLELLKQSIANDIKKNLEMRKDGPNPGTNN